MANLREQVEKDAMRLNYIAVTLRSGRLNKRFRQGLSDYLGYCAMEARKALGAE